VFVRGQSFSLYNAMIRRSPAYLREKKDDSDHIAVAFVQSNFSELYIGSGLNQRMKE
jgi:hypothetical protein